jgi:hypothetical protein
MRRWIFMAALGATLLCIPVWGQRGGHGGMAMGGARVGILAHGSGFFGAPPHGGNWSGGFHPGHGPGFPGHPSHPSHFPYHPYFRWRYPWGTWGYYGYPWGGVGVGWSDAYYSYPGASYPADSYGAPDNSSAYLAAEQQQEIDRLNDEVASLRAELAPSKPAPEPPLQIRAETVLVFRDRHSEKVENYAIVGGTLWVFTQQRARKIPIAELDIPTTTKANADRGIDFRLPGQK